MGDGIGNQDCSNKTDRSSLRENLADSSAIFCSQESYVALLQLNPK